MKTYSKDYLQEIAFPLSGIGCGGLSISGIGALVDWELTGKANKRSVNEYSHFAVKAERDGRVLDARVLQGDLVGCMIGSQEAAHHHHQTEDLACGDVQPGGVQVGGGSRHRLNAVAQVNIRLPEIFDDEASKRNKKSHTEGR